MAALQPRNTDMQIAICGTRGLPARHGGFETCVQEMATRLAARGHRVTVFAGADAGQHGQTWFDRVRVVYAPGLPSKHAFTITQTGLSAIRVALGGFDVVHVYNLGNAVWLPMFRLAGVASVISVDGLDWRRQRWGRLVRRYIERCAWTAVGWADDLIMDSRVVDRYYREHYRRGGAYVPYGAYTTQPKDTGIVERLGLERGRYVIFVGRFTPEKNVHQLIRAFEQVDTDMALALVGGDPFAKEYVAQLHATTDPRVRFPGYVYGDDCLELLANAYLYVTASGVEGTSPALLTAMGQGCCPLVNGIPENRETIAHAGVAYDENDPASLRAELQRLVDSPDEVARLGADARYRVHEVYNWDRVTDALEATYRRVAGA